MVLYKKKRKLTKATMSKYVDTSFIKPTTCAVERLFSVAKYVDTDHQNYKAETLEMIMMLKCNSGLWNASSIKDVNEYMIRSIYCNNLFNNCHF